jgi:signal peptidase I
MKNFLLILFVCSLIGAFLGSTFFGSALSESMEPTMMPGDVSFINRFEKPSVGDIVAFSCNTTKCGTEAGDGIIHRLVSVDQAGCMSIEGDNQPVAIDTRDYGCLMPSEVSIDGVVHPISFLNQ